MTMTEIPEIRIEAPSDTPPGLEWFRLLDHYGFRGVLGRHKRLILGSDLEALAATARNWRQALGNG